MKRTALALILTIALVISAVAGLWFVKTAIPKTITVPDDYPTIQAAIGNATDGDTIYVKKGTYNEPVSVDKTLTLTGEDRQETVIVGSHYRIGLYSAIHVIADKVTISGFTVVDSDVGILLENYANYEYLPSGCKIIGNNIVNSTFDGIYANGENHVISGNSITGGDSGIYFSSSNSIISENNIAVSGLGISITDCKDVTITGNSIKGKGSGLSLDGTGPFYVYGNTITDNRGFGLQFARSCNNAIVYNNNIERNGVGIDLRNFATEGKFATGTLGSGNVVYKNNFIDNLQQVVVNKKWEYDHGGNLPSSNGTDVVSWDNRVVGNYWSDYVSKYPNATRVGASGIGDTPYVIDENNIDHYPLMQSVDISVASKIIVIVVVVSVVVVVVTGLTFYFKKRKH